MLNHDALARSEAVLKAVKYATRTFASVGPWQDRVPAVLRQLGEAADVSRVYVFENTTTEDGALLMSEVFEWCAPGIEPTIQLPDNHDFPYVPGLERWVQILGGGHVLAGRAREFPENERADLEDEGIRSTAFVPIFAGDVWWGYMGYDDCATEREWSELEITALEAAADTLGGAILRHRATDQLQEAESLYRALVEQIPAIIYVDRNDESWTTDYVGPQLEHVLGLQVEDWVGESDIWEEHLHPDDREKAIREYEEAIEAGGTHVQEYRMIRPDGRVVCIRDEFTVLPGEDGARETIQGVMFDITQLKDAEIQLRQAEARFRRLVEQIPAVIYMDSIDESATTTYISPQIEPMLGFTPEEWIADTESWFKRLHSEDHDRAWAEYMQGRESGRPWSFEYRMTHRDGHIVWVREEDMIVRDDSGAPLMVQGVMYDITAQKEAEEQLREAETKYRAVIEQIPAITYLDPIDENELSIYVSPQVEQILGCAPELWVSDPSWWHNHVHPDDEPRVWDTYTRHRESGEPLSQDYRMVRDDGGVVWIHEQATVLYDEQGEPWLIQGLMHDITARKEAEEQIAFLAYHDKLTGLANRALLEEMLEPALARARRQNLSVALLFMDLDNFKDVNDSLGHSSGDELLVQVAERLVEATRETDVVARQGGDEFLVMLADLEPGDPEDAQEGKDKAVLVAEIMAERVHKAMRAPFVVADTEIHSSISIGVSVFPLDAVDSRTLLKNADAAMYESKKARPGGYRLHAQTALDPLTQLSFTRRLRQAVKEHNWVLHYQPVVDLADGSLVGVEALLRWRRPKGGLILPGEFLPLAEEMGLMEIIGEWVLEELVRQAKTWRDKGIELNVSFNLSPRQLWQRDLADKIMKNLRESGVDPTHMIVEIQESTAMTDPAKTQRVLWSLHERGLQVAIDDFGTGYSPPARLKNLPVDFLKIDQPLVRDLPEDAEVGNFLQAVMQFAKELEITPLAVGIETEEQRRFLLDQGCRLGQGYLFSKPVPAEKIADLSRRSLG